MNNNRLIIAAAGSGKTTKIINEALRLDKVARILITTYTEANRDEIITKFQRQHGCVPSNIDVLTWFSFLLKHGVRPYQTTLDSNLEGVKIRFKLVNNQSDVGQSGGKGQFYKVAGKKNVVKYYFTNDYSIYSDKISDFIIETDKKSDGAVFDRLQKLYSHIFIDEAQDLAGWDLEIIKVLSHTLKNFCMVCDPRQTVYMTNHSAKYPKYRGGKIKTFIEEHCGQSRFEIDECSLRRTHRFGEKIAGFSSLLFPDFAASQPCNESKCARNDSHQGIFTIRPDDVEGYLEKYPRVKILRYKESDTSQNEMNIRLAKGLDFDRVLIYPTAKMSNYMKTGEVGCLNNSAKTIFYVALTRARISIAIVHGSEIFNFNGLVSSWMGDE